MYYANKKRREALSVLSSKVFGTRSKWQCFVKDRGYTIDSIELQMKALEVEIDKQLKEQQDLGQATSSKPVYKRPNRKVRRQHDIR